MAQVEKHCSAELEGYAACVDGHPATWGTDCAAKKVELNACAAKYSGLVTSLKQRCREEIEQYDRCLKANTAYPATCTPQLERLWQCSENAQAGPCECGDPSHHGS
uniref:IMS import disulfide relay-system CHCH-CHCH-like Cx9C domain-containing protein n=1 Tax=Haptolina ericina TaxID=156174 RepID=A0A7S3FIX8_9EUKA